MEDPEPWNLTPPDSAIISKNIDEWVPPPDYQRDDQVVLHLGCGAVPCHYPNTLSLDVLPLPNVDIVCWAESLPFADGSVDLVCSDAVFEHLRNPLVAVAESKRILKPGGLLIIGTAFLQPFHGYPSHYFNMTPVAIEAHLCGGFDLVSGFVPPIGGPAKTIEWLLSLTLSYLPAERREKIRQMRVADFLDSLSADPSLGNSLMQGLSEHATRSSAASYCIMARKPEKYDPAVEGSPGILRYYETRAEVILRRHEIDLYRQFCAENGADCTLPGTDEPLDLVLERNRTTADLKRASKAYEVIRDVFIIRWMDRQNSIEHSDDEKTIYPALRELAANKLVDQFGVNGLKDRPGLGEVLDANPASRFALLPAAHVKQVRFEFGINDLALLASPPPDGVVFRLILKHQVGAEGVLWSKTLTPATEPGNRGIQKAEVSVKATDTDQLVFETLPVKALVNNWAFWRNLIVLQ